MAKVTPSCWAVTAFWWKRRKLPMGKLQWFIGGVSWWLFGLHHPVPLRKVNVYQSFFDAWTCDHSLYISYKYNVWCLIFCYHHYFSLSIIYHHVSLFIVIVHHHHLLWLIINSHDLPSFPYLVIIHQNEFLSTSYAKIHNNPFSYHAS